MTGSATRAKFLSWLYPDLVIRGRRLEHPRPIALLCQHPRRSNGHIIYYAGGHELALEMRFPDPVHGEVPQVVYAFRGHLLSKVKTVLPSGVRGHYPVHHIRK